ncbi:AAA family ATPase [Pyxidicoccus caerfyrddinensis]|uniref:AAA family ATPase n=1 Tax=Pyxidicoccus caerfyrddinensis TaxID=2709663 RepID=UPI0013DBB174|nr:MoxR family ATPase [Pyxidicoccus caerfyrddinensis]
MANQDWVSRLLLGRASADTDKGITVHLSERDGGSLHDKMRQAYWWITNNAVICPYYDLEFGQATSLKTPAGDVVHLPEDTSYSSFVLIPLLTLFTCRRALLVGGPGRGKTTSAVLMALLSGMSRDEVHRGIQRGHPQLSIADLLGAPLPSDMLKAEDLSAVKVSWRKWIGQRVKIIDEYNRIPTKTQSALLSLMAEGYAEMMDQYVYAGRSSWFLTANDDQGGGTFQVIEALKDRIDVVVRAVPFNSGFMDQLLQRLEADKSPEELLPKEIVFTPAELERAYASILEVEVPKAVLERIAFFLGQLDFCRMASPRFEFKHKDTLKLAGQSVAAVCNEQCPLDKRVHLCTQTENGVSVRAYQTILHFAKAMAFFRGHDTVELEDFRQIAPWVLHEKLVPNTRSAFFEVKGHRTLLQDRVAWIRHMFDMAMFRYETHEPIRRQVAGLRNELDQGLAGVDLPTTEQRIAGITTLMNSLLTKQELSGPVYEDLIHLKSMYSRYRNYATWLKENPGGPA